MLLALRSLWEEQAAGGTVTGTVAVTAAPATSAASGAVVHPMVGGKTRRLRLSRGPRIAQWSEAIAPVPVEKPEPIIIAAQMRLRAAQAECRAFGSLILLASSAGITDPGY